MLPFELFFFTYMLRGRWFECLHIFNLCLNSTVTPIINLWTLTNWINYRGENGINFSANALRALDKPSLMACVCAHACMSCNQYAWDDKTISWDFASHLPLCELNAKQLDSCGNWTIHRGSPTRKDVASARFTRTAWGQWVRGELLMHCR